MEASAKPGTRPFIWCSRGGFIECNSAGMVAATSSRPDRAFCRASEALPRRRQDFFRQVGILDRAGERHRADNSGEGGDGPPAPGGGGARVGLTALRCTLC